MIAENPGCLSKGIFPSPKVLANFLNVSVRISD